jgi:hypothetical protein
MREARHGGGHLWTTTSVVDAEAIDHERLFGDVQAVGELIRIRVAQRVDFDLLAEPVTLLRHPARITLGHAFELVPGQAHEVSRRLGQAASFADEINGRGRPQLLAGVATLRSRR